MFQLSISAACAYVRKVLDEFTSVEEIGMLVSPDAVELHKLVEASMVEAVVKITDRAPAVMIDGVMATQGTDFSVGVKDEVLTISMLKDTARIASVKVSDSEVIVCELIPEDSAEGRKQLDKYVRGVPDDPKLVLAKVWAGDYLPKLRYYTTKSDDPTVELEYVPYPVIDETIVEICPKLEYAILNELAAMVLDSLNEHDRATLCREKVAGYLEGR